MMLSIFLRDFFIVNLTDAKFDIFKSETKMGQKIKKLIKIGMNRSQNGVKWPYFRRISDFTSSPGRVLQAPIGACINLMYDGNKDS